MLSDLSLTPFLLLAQVGAWVMIVRAARLRAGISDEVERDAVALACLLLIWAAGLSAAALAGLLRLPAIAGLHPVMWLGLVPYGLVALSLVVLPSLRAHSLRLLDRTPIWLLPLLQSLRLAGLAALWPPYVRLGGPDLLHALLAEPLPFVFAGLDLVYALSGLVVALLLAKSWMGPRALFAWLAVGALLLLVPRLGIMNQSLGLAFTLFYLPLDPQGLLGYPHVLNYGLIGPGFVLLAVWQAVWVLRRSLAAPLTIASGQPAQQPSRKARNLGALIAPLQAMAESFGGQSAERRAELRAERRAKARERAELRSQAQAEKAAAQADKRARRDAERQAQKAAEKEAKLVAKQAAQAAKQAERKARKSKPVATASPVSDFGAPPALPEASTPQGSGATPPPLDSQSDELPFDTSPFQIEPLPERAWSKAHDLFAEPDIPFEDPLMPTNVAPLPSEVPPPAPPPLDPIFQSLAPGPNPDEDGADTTRADNDLPPLKPRG